MARTRLSSKHQIVIPKDVRNVAGVQPGPEFQVITKGGMVTLVAQRPLPSMRGFVRGIRTSGFREKNDRLQRK